MRELIIGVQVVGDDAQALVNGVVAAERAGIDAAWIATRPLAPDPLAVFSAAAMVTEEIRLGTCIMPIFPRHPLALVQSALAVDALAPGRLRLGVGPSARAAVEQVYGLPFVRPLAYLREYLGILTAILGHGKVDYQGERLTAVAALEAGPTQVQVMASALNPNSARLAGELTDGVIPWMCAPDYLHDVIVPAIREGALPVGRQPPPLVAHVPAVVSGDIDAVRLAARRQLGHYPRLEAYRRMFERAGFAEAGDGVLSDRMIEAIVAHGSAEEVEARLRTFAAAGAREVIVSPIALDDDPASVDRTLSALGAVATRLRAEA